MAAVVVVGVVLQTGKEVESAPVIARVGFGVYLVVVVVLLAFEVGVAECVVTFD